MGGLQAVVCQREFNYNDNDIDDDNGDIVQQYNVIHYAIDAKPHVCGDSGLSTVDFRAEPICWNQTSQKKIKGVRIMLKDDNGNNDIVREY